MTRIRDVVEIPYWKLRTGPKNSISDIEGIRVGHVTLIEGKGPLIPGRGPVRTGVTVVLPHDGNLYKEKVVATAHVINGFTKAVGLIQVEELGLIETPIALTNTLNVGLVADGLIELSVRSNPEIGVTAPTVNPLVLECNDGYLNDIQGRHVKQYHVLEAVRKASTDFAEGAVGAGTGTVAFGFKGGIGTSSRIVTTSLGTYLVGVLVQTNFGKREDLTIGGVPVGKYLRGLEYGTFPGSVNVIVATDAPLTYRQLRRIAKRVQSGLARVGGYTYHGSGEVVVAFTTAYRIKHGVKELLDLKSLPDEELNEFFRGVIEATEEATLNSMFNSVTIEGRDGHVAYQIPVERVVELIRDHHMRISTQK
ncbi:MAG: P1 family peptidase [Sulfolobales archaeon]